MAAAENSTNKGSIDRWNRQIHIYLGLFLLCFLWLFSVSGLVMNHPKWFGHKVDRKPSEQTLSIPETEDPVARAKAFQKQLDLSGEIILRKQRKQDAFAFMVMRPNYRHAINVDLKTGVAKINHVTIQTSQIIGQMHTFSGVRGMWNEPRQERDWIVTRLWSLSMDAVCVGLILLVLSSLYMAFQIKEKRLWVALSFGLGVFLCAYFLVGLTKLG